MKRNISPHYLGAFEDFIPDLQKLQEKIEVGDNLPRFCHEREHREIYVEKYREEGGTQED